MIVQSDKTARKETDKSAPKIDGTFVKAEEDSKVIYFHA